VTYVLRCRRVALVLIQHLTRVRFRRHAPRRRDIQVCRRGLGRGAAGSGIPIPGPAFAKASTGQRIRGLAGALAEAASRAMTARQYAHIRIPAARLRPSFERSTALERARAQGKPGVCAPAASHAVKKSIRVSPLQVRRNNPAFPARWFTTYLRALSGVHDLLVTVACEGHRLAHLAPAQGYQDHTPSPSAFMPLVAQHEPRPSHPVSRS
jgi:hypothetical protein